MDGTCFITKCVLRNEVSNSHEKYSVNLTGLNPFTHLRGYNGRPPKSMCVL